LVIVVGILLGHGHHFDHHLLFPLLIAVVGDLFGYGRHLDRCFPFILSWL